MQSEIFKIIPENLRHELIKEPELIKEVLYFLKQNPDFLKDNGIVAKGNIYDDIKAWAEKKDQNKN